jgi:hypothetical protein
MAKEITDDDISRIIGNRAIKHLKTMYPHVFAATYPSCRLSLRNTIRNDVNALLRAIRGNERPKGAGRLSNPVDIRTSD